MKKRNTPDLIDVDPISRPEAINESCRFPTKSGKMCGNRAMSIGVCTSHLRSMGGHLWILDCRDPDYREEDGEWRSFCRACGTVKDEVSAKELCPVRRNNPHAPCPTSTDLPTRLQYRFAETERKATVRIEGREMNAIRHGPFAARHITPCTDGRNWCVLHLPSGFAVALLDSEGAGLSLMKQMCKDGVELNFTDPMTMDSDARFSLWLSVAYLRKGRCIRAPQGILTRTAHRAYFQPLRLFHPERKITAECWGPFSFEPIVPGKILLHNPEGFSSLPIFEAPSRDRAVAFAKAAAEMDLEWHTSNANSELRYHAETCAGVGELLADFQDIVCLDPELLPELPPVRGRSPLSVTIATSEGPRTVSAYVMEGFAIHRPLGWRGGAGRGYAITHLGTGYLLGKAADLLSLFRAAEDLTCSGNWNFTKEDDMPSIIRTSAREILRQHGITPASQASHATTTFVM